MYIKTLTLLLIAAITLSSCDSDDENTPKITVSVIGAWATDIQQVTSTTKARTKMEKTPEVAYTQSVQYYTADGYVVDIGVYFDKDLNQVDADISEGLYSFKNNRITRKFLDKEYEYDVQVKNDMLFLKPVGEGQPVEMKRMMENKAMAYLARIVPTPPSIWLSNYSYDSFAKEFSAQALIFNKNGKLERLNILLDDLENLIESHLYYGFWRMNGLCLNLDVNEENQDYMVIVSKNKMILYYYTDDGKLQQTTFFKSTMYDIQNAYDHAEIHE